MKKLALLLTVCLLAWSAFAGCQTQETPPPQESEGSAVSASSTAQEGDPVVLCIEDSFEQDAYELENYLKATGVETEYEFLVLPDNTEDRETELTRLRTEIMAGEGPDAFILNATIPGYVTDLSTMEPTEALFPNVEKSMYSHLFLDVEEMVQNSETIDLANCNPTVMDVGVTSGGRFLLPLTYTFSVHIFDTAHLNDPNFTFTSLEELLQSDEESLKGTLAWGSFRLFPDCLDPLVDYEGQNLLVTREAMQQAVEQADALVDLQDETYSESPLVYQSGTGISMYSLLGLSSEDTEYTFFPVPNRNGGVTAAVTFYAAINANAAYPQEAFDFIELLYSEELFTEQGFEVNGFHYGTTFSYGNHGGLSVSIPVKDEIFFQYLESYDILPGTMASLRKAVERIDSAKVYSDLDLAIYQMYNTWRYDRPEETLEELVDRTVSTMEMTLAE